MTSLLIVIEEQRRASKAVYSGPAEPAKSITLVSRSRITLNFSDPLNGFFVKLTWVVSHCSIDWEGENPVQSTLSVA